MYQLSAEFKICHIQDANHIYFQNNNFRDSVELQIFEMHKNIAVAQGHPPENIILDKVYLVELHKDRWYRGRVVHMYPNCSFCNVFMIDYGNTRLINKLCFRCITPEAEAAEPNALLTSLYNIKPIQSTGWTSEAMDVINRVISIEDLRIMVVGFNSDSTQIEIIAHSPLLKRKIFLRNSLILHGYGKVGCKKWKPVQQNMFKELLELEKNCNNCVSIPFMAHDLHKDSVVDVTVVYFKPPITLNCILMAHNDMYLYSRAQFENHYIDSQNEYEKLLMPQVNDACAFYSNRGSWARGIVEAVYADKCTVRLVDFGCCESIDYNSLYELQQEFLFPIYVFECRLRQPLGEIYTEDHIRIIELLVTNQRNHFRIYNLNKCNNVFFVELSIWKMGGEIQLSQLYPQSHYPMEPTCPPLNMMRTVVEGQNNTEGHIARDGMIPIAVLPHANRIPFRINVCLKKNMRSLEELEKKIQLIMKSRMSQPVNLQYNVMDNCIVSVDLGKNDIFKFYRAIILKIMDGGSLLKVLLRDVGCEVEISNDQLYKSPKYLNYLCNSAIPCQMLDKNNIDENTILTIQKQLNLMLHLFTHFAMTVDQNTVVCDGIYPISLWGIFTRNQGPFNERVDKLINLNEYLVADGAMALLKKMDEKTEGNEVDELIDLLVPENDVRNYAFASLPYEDNFFDLIENDSRLKAWPCAQPIHRISFKCVPSYVDKVEIIFAHELSTLWRNAKLAQIIKLFMRHIVEPEAFNKFSLGQPCMVKNSIDGLFYRGIVIDVMPDDNFKVRCIDYGNVLNVPGADLSPKLIATNIPILANTYSLENIKSKNGAEWDEKTVKYLHHLVVGQECDVLINPKYFYDEQEHQPCNLRLKNNECVSQILVDEGFCKNIKE